MNGHDEALSATDFPAAFRTVALRGAQPPTEYFSASL